MLTYRKVFGYDENCDSSTKFLNCCVAETEAFVNAPYTCIVFWTLLNRSYNAGVWAICKSFCFGYTATKLCVHVHASACTWIKRCPISILKRKIRSSFRTYVWVVYFHCRGVH